MKKDRPKGKGFKPSSAMPDATAGSIEPGTPAAARAESIDRPDLIDQGNSAQTKEPNVNIVLTLDTKTRIGANAVYSVPGYRGLVYFPVSIFADGAPTTIELSGLTLASPKPKKENETPEARVIRLAAQKEARKNETPKEKAERAQLAAAKAQERAAKLAAEAAKLAQ